MARLVQVDAVARGSVTCVVTLKARSETGGDRGQEILCQFAQPVVWKNPSVLRITTLVLVLLEPDLRVLPLMSATAQRQVLPAAGAADSYVPGVARRPTR